ncbi:PD-(D/E)XK nuclease family protein [uncultured Brevibacterium sp.]|uniref:PD-(D/E)XK nuclease family protein n=1 Tax=uncultured Brevibacterium sp. TaxID=189678 RepID=UPI0025F8E88B|nr:PD-(D/E)XK nuclease family protein [uncultured Brevibacterium sp.]
MAERPAIDPALVTALVPTLSRSLAEQFNVFRVMHHGTHEKQLSNVFAWLLNAQGTHHLGDAPQRLFLELVNDSLPADSRLPTTGYDVAQEVVTPGSEGEPVPELADIADIVLSSPEAAIVVENFGTSDGHGHDFRRYLALGTANDRSAAVVLLCQRHEPHLQRDGWQRAVVITYAELLRSPRTHIAGHRAWIRQHPEQHFLIRQLFEHFVEGPAAMNTEDTLAFLTTMCETGESARYGHRPRDLVTQEFADLMAAQARRQFADSRALLASTKKALRDHADATLVGQVNAQIPAGPIEKVVTRFVGQWEWCVELQRSDDHPTVFFEFGPTAVAEQERVPRRLETPDYSQVFVSLQDQSGVGISRLAHTGVGLAEVLDGLQEMDLRLRDAVLGIVAQ